MDLGLMPKHTLLSDRQAKQELKSLNIDYERLPLISYADAAIQYLIQQGFDVSIGDVVKITRRSDTVGEAFYYRKVVL